MFLYIVVDTQMLLLMHIYSLLSSGFWITEKLKRKRFWIELTRRQKKTDVNAGNKYKYKEKNQVTALKISLMPFNRIPKIWITCRVICIDITGIKTMEKSYLIFLLRHFIV